MQLLARALIPMVFLPVACVAAPSRTAAARRKACASPEQGTLPVANGTASGGGPTGPPVKR